MRWKKLDTRKEGQIRNISKFLVFPKRIGDESRWLERVNIKQSLHLMFDVTSGAQWWEWRDIEWLT